MINSGKLRRKVKTVPDTSENPYILRSPTPYAPATQTAAKLIPFRVQQLPWK
ncbi:hypothetical protein [Allocoleopsis sp.]|uniref:hypothetical protein n=1 Tax=Allocoleopsis sp. TaxID=3088169 RepID=UPI002FD78E51